MSVELQVEPRKVYTWDEFREQKLSYSIALDGFVHDSTKRDPKGPYANFDHHTKSDRLATRSTSEQVHMEINMGLLDTFRRNGVPTAHVYVNDPDEDTCLAWWQLKNHELVKEHANPSINRLVYCEDRLDCTSGAYPFGDIAMRRKMAWVFQPYNMSRFEGRLKEATADDMKRIIETVGGRITEHISGGGGGEIDLEGHFVRIGGDDNWAFTRETGPASRMAMYNNGISAFVALVSEGSDGSFVYSIGKRSPWISYFDLLQFYRRLNKEEGKIITKLNKWGGTDTRGGSPRATGSFIRPTRVEEIIASEVRKKLSL